MRDLFFPLVAGAGVCVSWELVYVLHTGVFFGRLYLIPHIIYINASKKPLNWDHSVPYTIPLPS